MKAIVITIIFLSSLIANAQIVDFDNFSEERMNRVMFEEMNKYVKRIHHGDSLIWSAVVQKDVMTDNYNFMKTNSGKDLMKLHNPKWLGRNWNDLPDTIRTKIISEMNTTYRQSDFLKANKLENSEDYSAFTYTEILHSITFSGSYPAITYQEIARGAIKGWNNSPPHALYMNANYKNAVITGVATFFDKKKKTITISFVHVS
jgi:hypothetical protein